MVRDLQLVRALRLTFRSIAPRSTAYCHRTAVTCTGTATGWHRHARTSYSSRTTTGAVRLAYTLHESDDAASASALPPIVALDGLFGRRENLAKACKALAAATGRNVFAVDLRNHGDSPHTEDMDYTLTNADLELFLQDRRLSRAAFVGHSMGGRVAIKFALTKPSAVERLVVVDIAPSALPPALTTEWLPWQINAMKRILTLLSPDMSLGQALDVADQYLSRQVTKPYVRSFLLANLRKGPRGFEWQLNLKDIERNIPALGDPHYIDNESSNIDTLFIASDGSIYITEEDLKDIKRTFPNSRTVTIKGSTHWLYNDKEEEFVDLVREFMTPRPTEALLKSLSVA